MGLLNCGLGSWFISRGLRVACCFSLMSSCSARRLAGAQRSRQPSIPGPFGRDLCVGTLPGYVSTRIILVFLSFCVLLAAGSASARQGGDCDSCRPSNLEESNVWNSVFAGKEARLWQGAKIRACFLMCLFTNQSVPHQGVRISNATVEDRLDLTNMKIPPAIKFDHCTFAGGVDASSAEFLGNVAFVNCVFKAKAVFDDVKADGDLALSRSTFFAVADFTHAQLGADLDAGGAWFGDQAIFTGLQVGHTADFDSPPEFSFMGAKQEPDTNSDARQEAADQFQKLEGTNTLSNEFELQALGAGEWSILDKTNQKAYLLFRSLPLSTNEITLSDLLASCSYSYGIYSYLESYFSREGRTDIADKVHLEGKYQERDQILGPHRASFASLLRAVGFGRNAASAFWWYFAPFLSGALLFLVRDKFDNCPKPAFWFCLLIGPLIARLVVEIVAQRSFAYEETLWSSPSILICFLVLICGKWLIKYLECVLVFLALAAILVAYPIVHHRLGSWFLSWLLFFTIGFGRRPTLAALWSLAIIAIGVRYFRHHLKHKNGTKHKPPLQDSFFYTFDLFVPVIDLNTSDRWEPDGDEARWVGYCYKVLGYILIPIWAAALAGLIN